MRFGPFAISIINMSKEKWPWLAGWLWLDRTTWRMAREEKPIASVRNTNQHRQKRPFSYAEVFPKKIDSGISVIPFALQMRPVMPMRMIERRSEIPPHIAGGKGDT
jgi:hypothetical protein